MKTVPQLEAEATTEKISKTEIPISTIALKKTQLHPFAKYLRPAESQLEV